MGTNISGSPLYTITFSIGDTSQEAGTAKGKTGGQSEMNAGDIRDSQAPCAQSFGAQRSDQSLERQLMKIISSLTEIIDQLKKKLAGDNSNGRQDQDSIGNSDKGNDGGGDVSGGRGDIGNAGGGNTAPQSAAVPQAGNRLGAEEDAQGSKVDRAQKASAGDKTGLASGPGSADTTGATAGPVASQFPPRSLDEPDLPAEDVKARINGAVDRHWDQVRSSFNFENSPEGKQKAYAFFQGAASRESGTGDTMRTNLITGEGSSYSKGPLQTADTAYANNGHPDWIKDSHVPGIPQADLSMSNDLDTAISMGIRHMTEGAERAKLEGATSTRDLQMAAMAYHNTGHITAAKNSDWVQSYGNEVLKMADWYENGNTTNGKVVYTGQLS